MSTFAAPAAIPGTASVHQPTSHASLQAESFMLLLAQIVGETAQAAITPLPVQSAALSDPSLQATSETPDESLQLALLGLPLFPVAAASAPSHDPGAASSDQGAVLADPPHGMRWMPGADVSQALLANAAPSTDEPETATVDSRVLNEVSQPSLGAIDTAPQGRASAPPVTESARAIHVPVGHAQWADELGARLTTLVEQGRYMASLRLSPEHLGPLEVRITIHDDQASVWFGAAHAETRAAIEHALPRLRDMFEAQGMTLADAGIFAETSGDGSPTPSRAAAVHENSNEREVDATTPAPIKVGLIDAYA